MRFSRFTFVLMCGVLCLAACTPAQETATTPAQPSATPSTAPATGAAPPAGKTSPAEPTMRAATPAERAPTPPPPPAAPAAPTTAVVPAGTDLNVILIDPVSSDKNQAGDEFMASLGEPLVVGGKTVAAKGTKVRGRIVDAEGSGRVKGLASIRMVLTGVVNGARVVPIVTKPLFVEAESTKGRDAAVAGGGAGVGALIGAVAGGKKGAGVGAIVGGAAGTGAVLATKGKEVEFPSESKIKFTLDKDVELPIITKPTT